MSRRLENDLFLDQLDNGENANTIDRIGVTTQPIIEDRSECSISQFNGYLLRNYISEYEWHQLLSKIMVVRSTKMRVDLKP